MKPFINQFKIDFQKLMEERGLPVPADICNKSWVAGEISFGFTEPPSGIMKMGEHRVLPIVMIRVGQNERAAFTDLSTEYSKLPESTQQLARGIESPQQPARGSELCETTFGPPESRKRVVHGVANGWLAISTDIQFVNRTLKSTKGQKDPLSENPSFKKTMARTGLDLAADIKWFAKPLDIAELAMSPSPNRGVKQEAENEWLRFLHHEGFKVFTGIGGRAAFATDDHEMIQRCFVCQSEETASPPSRVSLSRSRIGPMCWGCLIFQTKVYCL